MITTKYQSEYLAAFWKFGHGWWSGPWSVNLWNLYSSDVLYLYGLDCWFFVSIQEAIFVHYGMKQEQPHEESKGSFFRAFDSKRVSHCYLHFCRDTKAGRGVGKLWKKRSSTCALSGEYWCGESVGSFINSTVIDRVHIWFFWLALTWKWDKKLGKLSVINRGLDIWGLLLQKRLLSFLYCYPSEHSIFYKTDL